MSRQPLFEARELACVRTGRLVFEGLEFALVEGDALLLRGPNGSGKSSLLRLLAGLVPLQRGRLHWRGEPVDPRSPEHRARLHFVGHSDATKAVLTVRENLGFAAALADGAGDPAAALRAFDLGPLADTPARYLSAGQRRRLALSRLCLDRRPLWLLDEPAVGLDARNRARLQTLLRRHRADGGICIVATHGDVEVEDALVLDFGAMAA